MKAFVFFALGFLIGAFAGGAIVARQRPPQCNVTAAEILRAADLLERRVPVTALLCQ